jgi:hypothetical protein
MRVTAAIMLESIVKYAKYSDGLNRS